MSQARNWCWTIHLAEENNDESSVLDLSPADCRYSVWQLERCPTTGRLHFQGYSEFRGAKRLRGVKHFLGHPTAHCERRNGPRLAAITYCKKSDTRVAGPWEIGSADVTPGRRTDLNELAEQIQLGKSLSEVRRDDPVNYIKYRKGIESLVFATGKEKSKEFRSVEVLVYWGDAGSGKTRAAVENASDYYILDQGERVWFDGYEGETTLIIDDFYGWIKYGQLLRILDGYQYRCEIKGGFTYAMWTKVIITSNKEPVEWYAVGLTPALERRITETIHYEIE